jgi:hypothetical protein
VRVFGYILVLIGALALGHQNFTYTSSDSPDAAGRQGAAEQTHTFWVPPVISGIAVVSGLLLVVTDSRRAEN